MKTNLQPYTKLFYLAVILIAIVLLMLLFLNKEKSSSVPIAKDKKLYIANILEKRLKKDADIIDSTESRFNKKERGHFTVKGLQYF